ncbi:MAG: hypothetical protein PUA50_03325 [Eubacteriales bacterium]|nr:hypothetical protein [Eubacteriales bacterium]
MRRSEAERRRDDGDFPNGRAEATAIFRTAAKRGRFSERRRSDGGFPNGGGEVTAV